MRVLDEAAFRTELERTGTVPERVRVDENGTIRDEVRTLASATAVKRALPPLTGAEGDIVLKSELSSGGMGTVLVAEQLSLGREVAVKRSTSGDDALVVEARVAGALEHPNIVPVYLLGAGKHGEPLLVMKRIEGRSWRDLLRAEGVDLERDVEILQHVCRALHFAHARGVIHRDVKPANVMVGSFGEVYLVDWGIAVGFGDRAPRALPHARDVEKVAGTPSYMAPEMALPDGTMDQRTDVYLVGAVLYELVAGAPPHGTRGLLAQLHAAHVSKPAFPEGAPEELVAICKRAMQRDPRHRYADVDELRAALATWQSHAAAREMCEGAEERLAELARLCASTTEQGHAERDVQRAFTEARFGFAQALRTWPSSTRAKQGLERAVSLMMRREIDAGRADAAALLARELDVVPPELAAALAALEKQRADEAANVDALVRFRREADQKTGQVERAVVMAGAAVGWLATMVVLHVLSQTGTYVAASGTFSVFMGLLAASMTVGAILFPRLRATTASRSMFTVMWCCVVALCVLHAAGHHFGIGPAPMLTFGHVCLAVTNAALAAQDARIWPGAACTTAIVPGLWLLPDHAYLVSGVGTAVALVVISLRWRPADPPRIDADPRANPQV